LKTTELLSNLISPCFYYLTNLVSGAYAPVVRCAPWSTVASYVKNPPFARVDCVVTYGDLSLGGRG
jgi:hypothetical protein